MRKAADFIGHAWRWKQRFGGSMRQAGVIAAACNYALDHNIDRLADDLAKMKDFAGDVRALLAAEGLPAVWYGHASVCCLHIRPLMDLRAPGAVARLRRIAEGVARSHPTIARRRRLSLSQAGRLPGTDHRLLEDGAEPEQRRRPAGE